VAARGYSFGKHGGPIPILGLGFLAYRSFLDTSLRDHLRMRCQERPEMALAALLSSKGIEIKVLGDSFGARRVQARLLQRRSEDGAVACRESLIEAWPMLWASKFPERCVVFVSLLEATDSFLLEMTIRYVGFQTRKPDEVVLFAMNNNILKADISRPSRSLAEAEIELRGQMGTGEATVRTADGEQLAVPLDELLASIRDRTSLMVRMFSDFGPPRSFTIGVVSVDPCPGGECSVVPSLFKAFDRELNPNTALFFASAERLANERVVAENLECVSACKPHCSKNSWCGQSTTRKDGAIYDLTMRRVAGYRDHTTVHTG